MLFRSVLLMWLASLELITAYHLFVLQHGSQGIGAHLITPTHRHTHTSETVVCVCLGTGGGIIQQE